MYWSRSQIVQLANIPSRLRFVQMVYLISFEVFLGFTPPSLVFSRQCHRLSFCLELQNPNYDETSKLV